MGVKHIKGKILISTSKGESDWGIYVKSHIRRLFYKSPLRSQALKRSAEKDFVLGLPKCAKCGIQVVKKEDYQIDHVEPIAPVEGWDSWDGFMVRCFTDKLEVLCKPCHKLKSKTENAIRRKKKL